MPLAFRYKGYRFFFFSNEGNPREPLHVHVRKGERLAKFWIEPEVFLVESHGFTSGELTMLTGIIEEKKNSSGGIGMNFLVKPFAKKVTFDKSNMWVELEDGRVLGVPLAYFPRLAHATRKQKTKYLISGGGRGLHWEDIDEDISVEYLVLGIGDKTHSAKASSPIPSERHAA
jgi:hypothetical protein